ncbi:hypothetical protein TPHA_0N00720 [Tetrapisispora phaffii CBS 4417]|uniref:Uncharacterized protein n=1 Tax=Tetrapisispora phaffii (strain ATCC 24235 / CBS 4417 / NBRC 1672 / NRRL Y-8282 / UCD 70-5) TaxID=1071381 RepID=G8C125_TETPH|nr:hypothetical protein TPHA_0N00720 [Tetrapisispora phaffii CBS 4417]CCE65853.1 hypothetical protein TPHA_0N00720 [Tetrapisispora phaffii CBS 4417]
MNTSKFAEVQRGHYTYTPPLKKRKVDDKANLNSSYFVKLLDGNELDDNVNRRIELFNQLYSHFHSQVGDIIASIETDLKTEIYNILFNDTEKDRKDTFKTLFLLGSDSSTKIELPKESNDTLNALIELTPKESPNVRMMLKRSMFKLIVIADAQKQSCKDIKTEDIEDEELSLKEEENDNQKSDFINIEDGDDNDSEGTSDVSYDLALVENFKDIFGKNLNLVFNFKDVDSINFVTLNDFVVLLKSALKYEHVSVSLVFNVNTNLSNIEKNLKQSTIRTLKKNLHSLDVSRNSGFKYVNLIFQSFLDTVDGKLNLSHGFVKFILEKMANNANHNLELLIKILDYALMTYFFENPFSIFIDPANVDVLDDSYLRLLRRCPTFMFFIEGLLEQSTTLEEVENLMTNKENALGDFFVEFLVRENPINKHAIFVADFLKNEQTITNFNLIELYDNLLSGNLETYLKRWPSCHEHIEKLKFESIDTIFQELFTLDNNSSLLSQALFPSYKSNMEDNLLNWERILPSANIFSEGEVKEEDKLAYTIGPILGRLFVLYREADPQINVFDFYTAFKEHIPKDALLNYTKIISSTNTALASIVNKHEADEEDLIDKITLILFMQGVFELDQMGFIRAPNQKSYDTIEKAVWRGV